MTKNHKRPIVVIESPYAGDVTANVAYAQRAMLDALHKGLAPFVSHLLYTQVLDDLLPQEREHGISAGLAFHHVADIVLFYEDRGWSRGMLSAREHCDHHNIRYEVVRLDA